MKKSYLLTAAVVVCFFANLAFALPGLKVKAATKKSIVAKKVKQDATIEVYLENASTTTSAEVELTNTSGGPSYGYLVSPNSNQTNFVEPGTYTVKITDGGPGELHVERFASNLYGTPGEPTPFTYTGYVTETGEHLVIVTI
jgi:hypothetical protein